MAQKHLEDLGRELGFSSVERDSFQYCGKRMSQDTSGESRFQCRNVTRMFNQFVSR